MDTYRTAAAGGYAVLVQKYKKPDVFAGNFWFGGNALHVCLNYLVALNDPNGNPDREQILKKGLDVYNKLKDHQPPWWKDDFGWWGNAFVYAINNRIQLGYRDPSHDSFFNDLLTAAINCWEKLWSFWSETPYNAHMDNAAGSPPDSYPVRGGSFNNSPTFPVKMSGRNSVTNEGFCMLSQDLANLRPGDHRYADAAQRMAGWFKQWLELPKKFPGKTGILNGLTLVLERPIGNQIAPLWYWSGDQGLFIQAQGGATGTLATDIANSVGKNMTDGDKVLHENLGFMEFPQLTEFLADYATGKGIFMRGLLGLALENRGTYDTFIKRNASAVWSNRVQGDQLTFNWNWQRVPNREPKLLRFPNKEKSDDLCDLIMQAAGQGALNAAFVIAPNEQIKWPPTA